MVLGNPLPQSARSSKITLSDAQWVELMREEGRWLPRCCASVSAARCALYRVLGEGGVLRENEARTVLVEIGDHSSGGGEGIRAIIAGAASGKTRWLAEGSPWPEIVRAIVELLGIEEDIIEASREWWRDRNMRSFELREVIEEAYRSSIVLEIEGVKLGKTSSRDAASRILNKGLHRPGARVAPVVCLVGSTRFRDAFEAVTRAESEKGNAVFGVACFTHADGLTISEEQKKAFDALHRRKIEMCDEVFVVNVDGYIGESSKSEIAYARELGKHVRYLEPVAVTS